MKEINKLLVLFLSITILVACDNDSNNGLGEEDPTSGWLQFDGTDPSVTYLSNDLLADGVSSIDIPFRYTAPINKSEIVLDYSTADVQGNSSDIIVNGSGSSTIAANTLDGTITLNIDLVSLEANIANTYVFDVVMQSNNRNVGMGIAPDFSSTYRVTIKTCDLLDLAGTYSATTTYGFHDFMSTIGDTFTIAEVEITAVGDGTFSIPDFSGGLWPGAYNDAYGPYPNGGNIPLVFSEVCGEVMWSGQTELYGDVLMQSETLGDNGPNNVDPDTGVITISFYCTGYGEYATSIYTPL